MSRNVGLVGQAPCYTPFSQQMSSAVGSIASMIAINEKHQNAYVPPPPPPLEFNSRPIEISPPINYHTPTYESFSQAPIYKMPAPMSSSPLPPVTSLLNWKL